MSTKSLKISDIINTSMRDYGTYVATSRSVPHCIDGLIPVQRRAIYQAANSEARNTLTKLVAWSGMTAQIHPHGNAGRSISKMVQQFPFQQNIALLIGKGTFGSEVEPNGIASERYVEAKLSNFALDVLVSGLDVSPMIPTFDNSKNEPLYIESKFPLIFCNPSSGIVVGFTTSIPPHSMREILHCMKSAINGEEYEWPQPYIKNWNGYISWADEDASIPIESRKKFYTNWGLARKDKNTWSIVAAPYNKDIQALKTLLYKADETSDSPISSIEDRSKRTFCVDVLFKRGRCPETEDEVSTLLGLRPVLYRVQYTVLWTDGSIRDDISPKEILSHFINHRRQTKRKEIEADIEAKFNNREKQAELVRFIREGWPQKSSEIKNRKELLKALIIEGFADGEWLADLPVHRLTIESVAEVEKKIAALDKEMAKLELALSSSKAIDNMLIAEWDELVDKYEPTESVVRHPRSGIFESEKGVHKKKDIIAKKPRASKETSTPTAKTEAPQSEAGESLFSGLKLVKTHHGRDEDAPRT